MVRNILGTIAGIIIAVIVVGSIESLGHIVFPPPAGTDLKNPETLSKLMDIIPLGAKIAVLVAWFFGALIGGWTALLISKWNISAWIVAFVMLTGSIVSLVTLPHPVWMAISAIILPFIAAYLAIRFGLKRT